MVSSSHHRHLSTGAIIGIAVAGALVLLIVAAMCFIWISKRRNAARLKKLRSPLDPRFGAENITAPNQGAYSSPQTSPGFQEDCIKMVHSPPGSKFKITQIPTKAGEWTGTTAAVPSPGSISTTFSNSNGGSPPGYDTSPPDSGKLGRESMPTHHAYIPPGYTPPSSNNVSPAYICVPPPHSNIGTPSGYPARSPSISARSGTSNTSPRYLHHSPNPSLSNNTMSTTRIPASPPLSSGPLDRGPISRSTSRMSHRSQHRSPNLIPNPSISPNLINSMPNSPPTQFSPPQSGNSIHSRHTSNSGISPPLPRPVQTRFEVDDEVRRQRERLFREGLAGRTLVHGREEPKDHSVVDKSPESDEEELWPGNY